MNRTNRPLVAVVLVLAVLASACSSDEPSEPQVLKGWDGEIIEEEAEHFGAGADLARPTQEPAVVTTSTSPPEIVAATTTTRALPPLTVPVAQPVTAKMVCRPLLEFYTERAVLRDELLTVSIDVSLARLETMSNALDEVPAEIPFFDSRDLFTMLSVERDLPLRLANGGAVSRRNIEDGEIRAETVHAFARDICVDIDHELINKPPVYDQLAEGVFALEESRRQVAYCMAADPILTARQDFIAATTSGSIDSTGREAYARFLTTFENGRPVIESNGPFLEFASDSDYRLRLDSMYSSVVSARLAIGNKPIPLNRHFSFDSVDHFAGELLDSIAEICPDLPPARFERTALTDLDVESLYVTPQRWQDSSDTVEAEACPRAHMLLASYAALADLLTRSDGSNQDHWIELSSYGSRVNTAAMDLGDEVGAVLGSTADRSVDGFFRMGYSVVDQELPSRGDQLRSTDDVTIFALAAAEVCTEIPADLFNPSPDVYHVLESLLAES